jgi:general secretion pathway protein M
VKEFFENLNTRERLLVGVAIAAVVCGLLYLVAVQPIIAKSKHYRVEVPKKRADLSSMREAALQVEQLKSTGREMVPAGGGSFLAAIDQIARQVNLGASLKRVEPDEQNLVRIWLEDAAFADIMQWLHILNSRYGVTVVSFSAERRTQQGLVNARVALKGAS